MIRRLRDKTGMALILTVLVVSLIVALTLWFSKSTQSRLNEARNLSEGIQVRWIAKSGINAALAILEEDRSSNSKDSLREIWADKELLSGEISALFDKGSLLLNIQDLSGRIQVNRLVDEQGEYDAVRKEILLRLLKLPEFGLDAEEAENIVDAIKDWIDPDDEVTQFGAEESYYMSLDDPYVCKNAPLEFKEELLLVRGITKELFYGTSERHGISNYLTARGDDGKININTADPLVLRSLSEDIDRERAQDMADYRKDQDREISDINWYKNVVGMGGVNIPEALLATSSRFFEITSKGKRGSLNRVIKVEVKRGEDEILILSWNIE